MALDAVSGGLRRHTVQVVFGAGEGLVGVAGDAGLDRGGGIDRGACTVKGHRGGDAMVESAGPDPSRGAQVARAIVGHGFGRGRIMAAQTNGHGVGHRRGAGGPGGGAGEAMRECNHFGVFPDVTAVDHRGGHSQGGSGGAAAGVAIHAGVGIRGDEAGRVRASGTRSQPVAGGLGACAGISMASAAILGADGAVVESAHDDRGFDIHMTVVTASAGAI